MSIEKGAAVAAVLVWLAVGGYLLARWVSPDAKAGGATVVRTTNGVTQTGVVETGTVNGEPKRVIRWETKTGTVIETVTGPMQFRTVNGEPILLAGPTSTMVHSVTTRGATHTVRGPGSTVTLPGQTVTETATQTVYETVTETVQNTVTDVVTVTETVTAP